VKANAPAAGPSNNPPPLPAYSLYDEPPRVENATAPLPPLSRDADAGGEAELDATLATADARPPPALSCCAITPPLVR